LRMRSSSISDRVGARVSREDAIDGEGATGNRALHPSAAPIASGPL
jgi:hypothetical protein